jgi:hypothetical protein
MLCWSAPGPSPPEPDGATGLNSKSIMFDNARPLVQNSRERKE